MNPVTIIAASSPLLKDRFLCQNQELAARAVEFLFKEACPELTSANTFERYLMWTWEPKRPSGYIRIESK